MLKFSRSRYTHLFLVTTLSLSACHKAYEGDGDEMAKTPSSEETTVVNPPKMAPLREAVMKGDEKIVHDAYLRANLPNNALAYIRIPNFWSIGGVAKGNVFDEALNAKAFFEAVSAIRTGFNKNVLPEIPEDDLFQTFVQIITQHITSPIEVTALDSVKPELKPNIMLSAAVDFTSEADIQALLERVSAELYEIEIVKGFENGQAEISIAGGIQLHLKWDSEKSRLFVLMGIDLVADSMTSSLASFVPNDQHQMLAIEETIDSSGHGLFAWVNPQKLLSLASSVGMERELAPLSLVGANSIKNMAIGEGTSGGISRLKYVIDMPVIGFRSYLPTIKTAPEFNLSGETKFITSFGLPSRTDFAAIENSIAVFASSEMEEYYELKKQFSKTMGFDIEDIFDFFGQDISYVSDEAGGYFALRLNDAEKFKATLEASVKELGLDYEQKTISGHEYHHLKIPSFYNEDVLALIEGSEIEALAKRFITTPGHLYWEQEGDYLILSDIPQILIDRHYIETKTPANEWLSEQQRMSPEGALIMVSVKTEGVSRRVYRLHLSFLNYLADLVGEPIDMFALATPHEVNIPKEDSFGFKITSDENLLALELNYESSPLEILFSGNSSVAVATVGVLAAIALPAYQDYVYRAEEAQREIDLYRLEQDELLNDPDVATFSETEPEEGTVVESMETDKIEVMEDISSENDLMTDVVVEDVIESTEAETVMEAVIESTETEVETVIEETDAPVEVETVIEETDAPVEVETVIEETDTPVEVEKIIEETEIKAEEIIATVAPSFQKIDTTQGDGALAEKGQIIAVHYTGWLYDAEATDKKGKKFDSSVDRGNEFVFPLGAGRVIKGWDEGFAGMKVGGKRTLIIPSEMGYGVRGAGSDIPPNATLIFDVELLEIK